MVPKVFEPLKFYCNDNNNDNGVIAEEVHCITKWLNRDREQNMKEKDLLISRRSGWEDNTVKLLTMKVYPSTLIDLPCQI